MSDTTVATASPSDSSMDQSNQQRNSMSGRQSHIRPPSFSSFSPSSVPNPNTSIPIPPPRRKRSIVAPLSKKCAPDATTTMCTGKQHPAAESTPVVTFIKQVSEPPPSQNGKEVKAMNLNTNISNSNKNIREKKNDSNRTGIGRLIRRLSSPNTTNRKSSNKSLSPEKSNKKESPGPSSSDANHRQVNNDESINYDNSKVIERCKEKDHDVTSVLKSHDLRQPDLQSPSSSPSSSLTPSKLESEMKDSHANNNTMSDISPIGTPDEPSVYSSLQLPQLRLPPDLPDVVSLVPDPEATATSRLYGSASELSRLISCDASRQIPSPAPTVCSTRSAKTATDMRKRSSSAGLRSSAYSDVRNGSLQELINSKNDNWYHRSVDERYTRVVSERISEETLSNHSVSPKPAPPVRSSTLDRKDIRTGRTCVCGIPPPPPPLQFTRYFKPNNSNQQQRNSFYENRQLSGVRVWKGSPNNPLRLRQHVEEKRIPQTISHMRETVIQERDVSQLTNNKPNVTAKQIARPGFLRKPVPVPTVKTFGYT